jgi:hypothetical protein
MFITLKKPFIASLPQSIQGTNQWITYLEERLAFINLVYHHHPISNVIENIFHRQSSSSFSQSATRH